MVKIHNFDTQLLKKCVHMLHTCPHMSIFGLQIHDTCHTHVKKCVLSCVVLDSSLKSIHSTLLFSFSFLSDFIDFSPSLQPSLHIHSQTFNAATYSEKVGICWENASKVKVMKKPWKVMDGKKIKTWKRRSNRFTII